MQLWDLMLHLKSLLWCLGKDGKRYNLRLIVDCLHSRHIPESIQRTPLGHNLHYLIQELAEQGGLQSLLIVLRKIPQSKVTTSTPLGQIELGQYLQAVKSKEDLPSGTYGVVSFIDDGIHGLFYLESKGLVERKIEPDQVKIIMGTTIKDER